MLTRPLKHHVTSGISVSPFLNKSYLQSHWAEVHSSWICHLHHWRTLSICTVKYHVEFSEGLPSNFLKSGTQYEFQFDSPHDLDPLLYEEDNMYRKEILWRWLWMKRSIKKVQPYLFKNLTELQRIEAGILQEKMQVCWDVWSVLLQATVIRYRAAQ